MMVDCRRLIVAAWAAMDDEAKRRLLASLHPIEAIVLATVVVQSRSEESKCTRH